LHFFTSTSSEHSQKRELLQPAPKKKEGDEACNVLYYVTCVKPPSESLARKSTLLFVDRKKREGGKRGGGHPEERLNLLNLPGVSEDGGARGSLGCCALRGEKEKEKGKGERHPARWFPSNRPSPLSLSRREENSDLHDVLRRKKKKRKRTTYAGP